MKFKWKSKSFFAALATVVCIGLGVSPVPVAEIAANGACAVVECEA